MKKPNIILLLLMVLACLAACHKDKEMDVKEAVVSNEEMTVSGTQARFSWQVDFAGQFQTGVEVSQSENMADLRRVEASKEEDKFVAVVDSLTEGTNYYYRFVVWNKFGSSAQSVGNFKTMETPPAPGQDTTYFEITVSVNLPEGGTATGGGRFAEGDTCTVTATANEGYNFVNWTENDIPVDTNSVYSFAVNSDRELVANFSEESAVLYTVNAKAEPEEGGTVTGGGTYEEGREIELKATANTGYAFGRWNDGSTDNPRTVTVTADATYTAYFNLEEYEIKVECQPENGGTATGGGTFHYGDTIALSATPNANFNFEGWSDGSTDNPHEVVVTGPATYKAIFSEVGEVYYHVTTHSLPTEGGTVTGNGTYLEGSQVELEAVPNDGYIFEKWDDGDTHNPRAITVNADMEFTAFFKKKTYTVTVQAGSGGTAHIGDMTGTIEATFEHGESCTVHALPETGYSFVKWTENGSEASLDENYSFEVTSDRNLVANFQPQQYWIGTSVEPTNSGTVSGGNRYYNHGEQCNLTATANGQYEFDHWTKDGSTYPGGSTITFTVTEAATYTAHFRLRQYTISVSASTGGSAHVGSATGPTTGTYTSGQQCTVYAVANSNYTFTNWTEVESGNVASTQANYTFTVTGNRNLRANFNYTPPQIYTITVLANPSNGGTVSGGGQYQQGQTCTVHATANSDYTFTNWTENGTVVSTQANYPFTVNGNRTLVANFTSNSGDHAYVDLGLPSGLLWATCNVGADNPEDYGDYFAWGETQPKETYNWSTYQYCMGSSNTLTKYCNYSSFGYNGFTDNLTTLQPEDDAATANWSNGWRMPTRAEFQELLNNTTVTWTTQNGVNGQLFTATNGNSLFLPAAGYYYSDGFDGAGSQGGYWSSSLCLSSPCEAFSLGFNSDTGYCNVGSGGHRSNGLSVRAVHPVLPNLQFGR